MCIRDRYKERAAYRTSVEDSVYVRRDLAGQGIGRLLLTEPVSYTHLRAHETVLDLVCRLLLENKNH